MQTPLCGQGKGKSAHCTAATTCWRSSCGTAMLSVKRWQGDCAPLSAPCDRCGRCNAKQGVEMTRGCELLL